MQIRRLADEFEMSRICKKQGSNTMKKLTSDEKKTKTVADGIWPTMITPYGEDGRIDYSQVERLIEFYYENGMTGIFAICQSSEMFFLDEKERLELADFILKANRGRMDIVVAGTVDDNLEDQLSFAKKAAELGPDAVVFLRNRLSDDFCGDLSKIIAAMPSDMPLGMYECPYPFKRYLTDDEVKAIADTDRFVFLKDTVCDIAAMRRRAKLVEGSSFKLYNANGATFYDSVLAGYNGYSGIMAIFHPDLYAWVYNNINDPRAPIVARMLGVMSLIECRGYPICAKTYLRRFEGFDMTDICRSVSYNGVPALDDELYDVFCLGEYIREEIIKTGTHRKK